jgi:hypothetical protein
MIYQTNVPHPRVAGYFHNQDFEEDQRWGHVQLQPELKVPGTPMKSTA